MQTPQDRVVGPRCGFSVEQGSIAYPCSRPQGHTSIPADDPEPHFAIEVRASVQKWSDWKDRQDAKRPHEIGDHVKPEGEDPCGGILFEKDGTVTCTVCGPIQVAYEGQALKNGDTAVFEMETDDDGAVVPQVKTEPDYVIPAEAQEPVPEDLVPENATRYFDGPGPDAQEMALDSEGRAHPKFDIPVPEHVKGLVAEGHAEVEAENDRLRAEGAFDDPEYREKVAEFVEHLKQREGDQVLPSGNMEDEDDYEFVIRDFIARRQVGVARYGQAHRPFYGRDTLLDAYEELLDLILYLRSVRRQVDADKDALVEAVHGQLRRFNQVYYPDDPAYGHQATEIVERIQTWVVGQRMQMMADVFPREEIENAVRAVLSADHYTVYYTGMEGSPSIQANVELIAKNVGDRVFGALTNTDSPDAEAGANEGSST